MRLAMKYQVDTIRARIIAIMHDNWPTTFDEWLCWEAEAAIVTTAHTDGELINMPSLKRCLPEPAAVLRFAQDWDVPSLLPFAFYTLAGIYGVNTWEMRYGLSFCFSTRGTARLARWDMLDAADRDGLARVRPLLTEKIDEVWDAFVDRSPCDQLEEVESPCETARHECRESWECVVSLWKEEVLSGVADGDIIIAPDPLDFLEKMLASRNKWKACDQCDVWMKGRIRDAQRGVWDLMLSRPWTSS